MLLFNYFFVTNPHSTQSFLRSLSYVSHSISFPHHRVHSSSPPDPIQNRINPIHIPKHTLIVNFHLRLGLPRHPFPSGFSTKFQYVPLLSGPGQLGGIATRYGLDGPRIESRLGSRFSAPVQTGPRAHLGSYTMGTGSFSEVKRLGRGADHPNPSGTEIKEIVELYF